MAFSTSLAKDKLGCQSRVMHIATILYNMLEPIHQRLQCKRSCREVGQTASNQKSPAISPTLTVDLSVLVGCLKLRSQHEDQSGRCAGKEASMLPGAVDEVAREAGACPSHMWYQVSTTVTPSPFFFHQRQMQRAHRLLDARVRKRAIISVLHSFASVLRSGSERRRNQKQWKIPSALVILHPLFDASTTVLLTRYPG